MGKQWWGGVGGNPTAGSSSSIQNVVPFWRDERLDLFVHWVSDATATPQQLTTGWKEAGDDPSGAMLEHKS